VSTFEAGRRAGEAREAVAGLIASLAIFVSLIGIVHRPARIIPVCVVLALVATRMTDRHRRLAAAAVVITALAWMVGMAVAVITTRPLY
jgi:hypothetical protein